MLDERVIVIVGKIQNERGISLITVIAIMYLIMLGLFGGEQF